jgi:hypothetical protein
MFSVQSQFAVVPNEVVEVIIFQLLNYKLYNY